MKVLDYDGTEHLINKLIDTINSGGSADYIVEEGTSGIWTYRKWASGIAECWGKDTQNATAYATVATGMKNFHKTVTYPPNLFIEAPAATFTCMVSNTTTFPVNIGGSSATEIDVYATAYTTSTSALPFVSSMHVRGLWKTFTPSVSRMNPKKGTFTCVIPRLANQNVTFNYTQVAENVLVAAAEITANTSSDSGRLYLYFEGSPSGLPFTPLKGFGGCECSDVCYSMASSSNKNLWIGGLTGTMASGKYMAMRFILIG